MISTDNALYYKTQTAAGSSTWSSTWTSLGGSLRDNSDPKVVPNADGRLDAFAISLTSSPNEHLLPTQRV